MIDIWERGRSFGDRRHEGIDAGELPEDAARRHPLWAEQTRGVVQRSPGLDQHVPGSTRRDQRKTHGLCSSDTVA